MPGQESKQLINDTYFEHMQAAVGMEILQEAEAEQYIAMFNRSTLSVQLSMMEYIASMVSIEDSTSDVSRELTAHFQPYTALINDTYMNTLIDQHTVTDEGEALVSTLHDLLKKLATLKGFGVDFTPLSFNDTMMLLKVSKDGPPTQADEKPSPDLAHLSAFIGNRRLLDTFLEGGLSPQATIGSANRTLLDCALMGKEKEISKHLLYARGVSEVTCDQDRYTADQLEFVNHIHNLIDPKTLSERECLKNIFNSQASQLANLEEGANRSPSDQKQVSLTHKENDRHMGFMRVLQNTEDTTGLLLEWEIVIISHCLERSKIETHQQILSVSSSFMLWIAENKMASKLEVPSSEDDLFAHYQFWRSMHQHVGNKNDNEKALQISSSLKLSYIKLLAVDSDISFNTDEDPDGAFLYSVISDNFTLLASFLNKNLLPNLSGQQLGVLSAYENTLSRFVRACYGIPSSGDIQAEAISPYEAAATRWIQTNLEPLAQVQNTPCSSFILRAVLAHYPSRSNYQALGLALSKTQYQDLISLFLNGSFYKEVDSLLASEPLDANNNRKYTQAEDKRHLDSVMHSIYIFVSQCEDPLLFTFVVKSTEFREIIFSWMTMKGLSLPGHGDLSNYQFWKLQAVSLKDTMPPFVKSISNAFIRAARFGLFKKYQCLSFSSSFFDYLHYHTQDPTQDVELHKHLNLLNDFSGSGIEVQELTYLEASALVEGVMGVSMTPMTPLHFAVLRGQPTLCEAKADDKNATAAHLAAFNGDEKVVDYLYERGFNRFATTKQGAAALDFAMLANQNDLARHLINFWGITQHQQKKVNLIGLGKLDQIQKIHDIIQPVSFDARSALRDVLEVSSSSSPFNVIAWIEGALQDPNPLGHLKNHQLYEFYVKLLDYFITSEAVDESEKEVISRQARGTDQLILRLWVQEKLPVFYNKHIGPAMEQGVSPAQMWASFESEDSNDLNAQVACRIASYLCAQLKAEAKETHQRVIEQNKPIFGALRADNVFDEDVIKAIEDSAFDSGQLYPALIKACKENVKGQQHHALLGIARLQNLDVFAGAIKSDAHFNTARWICPSDPFTDSLPRSEPNRHSNLFDADSKESASMTYDNLFEEIEDDCEKSQQAQDLEMLRHYPLAFARALRESAVFDANECKQILRPDNDEYASAVNACYVVSATGWFSSKKELDQDKAKFLVSLAQRTPALAQAIAAHGGEITEMLATEDASNEKEAKGESAKPTASVENPAHPFLYTFIRHHSEPSPYQSAGMPSEDQGLDQKHCF